MRSIIGDSLGGVFDEMAKEAPLPAVLAARDAAREADADLLIAVGAGLYAIGVIFHLWERLRFHNAIWHGFVLIAAGCHYAAILGYIALAAPST